MTNRNSSNINIPEAREAMDKFKMEAASDVGVPRYCFSCLHFHSPLFI